MKVLFTGLNLIAISSAQSIGNYFRFYANNSTPPYNNTAFTSVEPNATREVSFNRAQTSAAGRNWTWTLSISDVALPDISEFRLVLDNVPEARAAYTTYSFDWPQDGNVNEAVAKTGPQCLYNIFATFPQNVSNAWDPSSSSCASAIGIECEVYILNQMSINKNGCRAGNVPSLSLLSVPQCASSFGAVTESYAVYGYDFGNDTAPANATTFDRGDTVAWTLSNAYSASNTTAFEIAKNRMQMAVIGNAYGTRLLCNRIGDGLEMESVADGGNDNDEEDDQDEKGSSTRNSFSVAVVGMAALFVTALGSM